MSPSDEDLREQANQRLRNARAAWGQAMTAHKMAPPDVGFASRLRALSVAAQAEREACEEADRAGLLWRPIPGAQTAQPPYELRPATGRRGPAELWERFDSAVQDLNHAITWTNVLGVARAFAELSAAAEALADAVEGNDRDAEAGEPRQQAV